MDSNFYMINRQEMLFMVQELHRLGFEKLRIIPSLSPSGTHWRCTFIDNEKANSINASNWISSHEKGNSQEKIKQTPQELAALFIKENSDFTEYCVGKDEEYVEWYSAMIKNLKNNELPYAYSDYFSPTDFWRTSLDNEIKTLPNEDKYYF